MPRITVIANPWAGRGRARRVVDALQRRVTAGSLDARFCLSTGRGHAERLARESAKDCDVVCIVGGDGTVHEVVNGLMPSPPPVAIVPAGTGNDFAHLIPGPRNAEELAAVVSDGYGARVDVLAVGDRYCTNGAGLGFEGIINRYSHSLTRLSGTWLYLAAVMKALGALECPNYTVRTAEGETIDGPRLAVSIGNGVRTGGGFYLTPDALPDDGLIDVCVIEAMGRLKALRLLPTVLRSTHVRRPEVRMLRSKSLEIQGPDDVPMHIDGELYDPAPAKLRIEVVHRALTVLCDRTRPYRLAHGIERIELGGN